MIKFRGHFYRKAHTLYPNTAAGAVNYAVEEIPGLASSVDVEAVPSSDGHWLVLDHDQEKAYIVELQSIEGSYVPVYYKKFHA